MTAARSAPSGPVISPEGGAATQGRLTSQSIASGAAPVTCVSVPVFAGGGSFLLSAECQAASAAALTAARYDVIFTPTGGAPSTIASRLLTDISTTPQAFRLLALIVKVLTAGELKIVIDNRGSQELIATGVDAQIQPVTITT
jgi:hypothetical protein